MGFDVLDGKKSTEIVDHIMKQLKLLNLPLTKLRGQESDKNSKITIKRLCPTRWSSREDAVSALTTVQICYHPKNINQYNIVDV